MLAAGFGPAGVFAEQRRIDADLPRDEGEHRRGWRLGRVQRADGMAEHTKLDGETETVAGAPPCPDGGQIGVVEHVVLGHGGLVGRDREQPDSLLGREQGASGQVGLRLAAKLRS